jgi:glycosyltransferase involved in cell wall biosynthesis|tara:strand:- start:734 stop:1309 length:576 start_codon:yes stop_codon:yes gene_type:complete
MKLSILIPSVPSRRKFFLDRLLDDLEKQIGDRKDIEILVLYDNKTRSLGQKRSDLLNLAKGQFTVFIDDDDRISEDYISSIMEEIEKDPAVDCIVYDTICTMDGGIPIHCKYGIELNYNHNSTGNGYWTGKPAHTMVYSSRISKKHAFIDANYGEDMQWVSRAVSDLKTQARIDKILYYYDFNSNVTETRG